MSRKLSRREFVKAGAVAGAAVGSAGEVLGAGPALIQGGSSGPVVIASANGNRSRNAEGRTCVEEAFARIAGGEDVLDALIAGVNVVELDPEDSSVGYGGLPNADGVVQLDASVMHGPKKRAGAVAAIEGVRTPSRLAKAVMELTDHHLIVGEGARRLARQLGYEIEDDLNTDKSRGLWLEWKRRSDPLHYLDPDARAEALRAIDREMIAEGLVDAEGFYGTINCNGLGVRGELCGVTTTSGLAWKIPGRVGDSPILGAGLYVDGEVGAAGSTGRGEANLYSLASFLVVEELRRGRAPKDAAFEALRRIGACTVERRLLTADGRPGFDLKFYVLDRGGAFAGVSMWAGEKAQFAVCTERGAQTLACESLYGEKPEA